MRQQKLEYELRVSNTRRNEAAQIATSVSIQGAMGSSPRRSTGGSSPDRSTGGSSPRRNTNAGVPNGTVSSMHNGNIVVETTGLSKSYGPIQAVRSLDLKVKQHSIFAFLGPNGAGKSTTIKMLLGLTRPTGGSAKVFGLDVQEQSVGIRSRIGYLAQDPRFYGKMTARQTLEFVARFFYSGPKSMIDDRIDETLELVGLTDLADRQVGSFSGGERQRLGIAQAQINYPDLLILDEPAASLDPMGRRDVLTIMERLRKHTTILYSTHILSDVQRVSDTVAIMSKGELVAQAPIDELLAGTESVTFTMTLRGDLAAAHDRVSSFPWIRTINLETVAAEAGGAESWSVSVSDEPTAERELLRAVLSSDDVVVTHFSRMRRDLEDVFVRLVERGEEQ